MKEGGMKMYKYPYYVLPYFPANYYAQPQMDFRQQPSVQEAMQTLRSEHQNLYNQFEQAGLNRGLTDYIFQLVVGFTLNQANTNQSANQIYNQFQRQVPWLNLFFQYNNVSQNVADRILTRVIQI